MRLFVALHPPSEALDDLAGQLGKLRISAAARAGAAVRLVEPATAHVTLVFIGEIEPDRLPTVLTAVGRAAGRYRAEAGPLRIELTGGGVFGAGRSTVLWVGVRDGAGLLDLLAALVREELDRDRLPYDVRPFRAHLTIARPGDRVARTDVDADRQALDGYRGPAWPATELTLVRSHLGQPTRHDRLATWSL